MHVSLQSTALEQELTKFFGKGSKSKYLRLCRHVVSVATIQLGASLVLIFDL